MANRPCGERTRLEQISCRREHTEGSEDRQYDTVCLGKAMKSQFRSGTDPLSAQAQQLCATRHAVHTTFGGTTEAVHWSLRCRLGVASTCR